MQSMLQCLEDMESEHLSSVSLYLVTKINDCIMGANKHKLPTAAQGHMWSSFHTLRCDVQTHTTWNTFVSHSIADQSLCIESRFVLQLLMDRMLKRLIENKAKEKKTHQKTPTQIRPLTSLESNAIRYMAGYVAIKLLRRYERPTKHPELKKKYKFYVDVLHRMKAQDLPGEVSTVYDYTRLWSEQIDRGGLYHISDKVHLLFEAIEVTVRRHFNTTNVHADGEESLKKKALDEALTSEIVLEKWERVAGSIPQKFEKYSLSLLQAITQLWLNVRGHSFAQNWTMKFERKYKKGTRKSLKPQTIDSSQ